MILSLLYVVLALLLVTAVASATSIHLERKALLALADGAALAAATALDEEAYYARTGGEEPLMLTDASVAAAVERHVAATAADDLEGLAITRAVAIDGRTAEVTLAAVARPPLITWVTAPWSDGIRLEVTTRARAG
ncbi:hypothetical protein GXB85_11540 [Cellulomonas sp. APG4]|nr:hypothetical protein [Cellulomonas sp. APG4]NCT91580.1 hypothetical protein [Cellulomonas sp. APG4]